MSYDADLKVLLPMIAERVHHLLDSYISDEHSREWWKTYRASLSGIYAMPVGDDAEFDPDVAHKCAEHAANIAHGSIKP